MTARTPGDSLVVAIFGEIVMIEQLARSRISRDMPKGMELSHFMVLNHFARLGGEKTPMQLARIFHVTKGAMSNTIRKLDAAGYVHVRPDWDDARKKWVRLSPAGRAARDHAVACIAPVLDELLAGVEQEELRAALPILRTIRQSFGGETGAELPEPQR
ncbi:MAG: MarR family transcriptional regulator [Pseudomonadota bacterium]